MASVTSCRFCGLPIDAPTAASANAAQQALNSAIIQADGFKYSIGLAAVVGVLLVLNASGVLVDVRLFTAWLAAPTALFAGWRWNRRHGSLNSSDTDLLESRQNVQRAMCVWMLVLAVEMLLVAWVGIRWGLTISASS